MSSVCETEQTLVITVPLLTRYEWMRQNKWVYYYPHKFYSNNKIKTVLVRSVTWHDVLFLYHITTGRHLHHWLQVIELFLPCPDRRDFNLFCLNTAECCIATEPLNQFKLVITALWCFWHPVNITVKGHSVALIMSLGVKFTGREVLSLSSVSDKENNNLRV